MQPGDLDQERDADLVATYLSSVASIYTDLLQRAVEELPYLPSAWRQASTTSDFALRLTPAELDSLVREIFAVVERYRREDQQIDVPEDASRSRSSCRLSPVPARSHSGTSSDERANPG